MASLLEHETAALQRIAANGFDLKGCSHGYSGDELIPDGGKQYMFHITPAAPSELLLVVDAYSALRLPDGKGFDDDQWHDMQMEFRAPATRADYRRLATTARGLIKGYTVPLGGCTRAKLAWLAARRAPHAPWFLED